MFSFKVKVRNKIHLLQIDKVPKNLRIRVLKFFEKSSLLSVMLNSKASDLANLTSINSLHSYLCYKLQGYKYNFFGFFSKQN